MRTIHVAMLAIALSIPLPSAAQSGAANAVSQDTSQPAPKKKKGGLFGKVKALTQNKTLQQVAKTAACNMVPGGQLVAGAIDHASAKNAANGAAKDAAKDAATGAALGAAAGKKNTCAPGMGLMGKAGPGLAGGMPGGGIPGAGVPGLPTTGMPGPALSAEQLKQMQEQYRKMGMDPEQIKAMQLQMQATPPGATGVGMSPEQLKQMQEQYRKMGMDSAQLAAMQEMMAGMSGGSEVRGSGAAPAVPGAAAPSAAPSLTKEKGRLVLRQLPWNPGSETIQAGAEPVFGLAIRDLAGTILTGTPRYKVEVRVEDQGSKAQSHSLAQKRAAVVVTALVREGIPQTRLVAADGGSDKDPRVVVSETK